MTFSEPDDVLMLADGCTLTMAGCDFTVGHVPGHTPGSVTFRTPGEPGDAPPPGAPPTTADNSKRPGTGDVLFTGDLLFAGSIGRTDLPGGDHQAMLHSLARALTLPDDTLVLPGHGPQTTIGAERRANPFLTGLQPAQRGL